MKRFDKLISNTIYLKAILTFNFYSTSKRNTEPQCTPWLSKKGFSPLMSSTLTTQSTSGTDPFTSDQDKLTAENISAEKYPDIFW